jgi:hypothetical protein
MSREATLLAGGIGLGTALMYMFDPDRGWRRRALVRDQLVNGSQVSRRRRRDRARPLEPQARARGRGGLDAFGRG